MAHLEAAPQGVQENVIDDNSVAGVLGSSRVPGLDQIVPLGKRTYIKQV